MSEPVESVSPDFAATLNDTGAEDESNRQLIISGPTDVGGSPERSEPQRQPTDSMSVPHTSCNDRFTSASYTLSTASSSSDTAALAWNQYDNGEFDEDVMRFYCSKHYINFDAAVLERNNSIGKVFVAKPYKSVVTDDETDNEYEIIQDLSLIHI